MSKNKQSIPVTGKVLRAALEYAGFGWHVLPVYGIDSTGKCACLKPECEHPGKHPKTKSGFKDATLEPKVIRRFCRFPDTNIGISTGKTSELWILDVDPKNGGDKSLRELRSKYGSLPKTLIALTGQEGGEHYYLNVPIIGIKSRNGFLPGLDFKSDGGYVVAPPSRHHSGRRYRWKDSCGPGSVKIATAPEWLLNLVKNPPAQTKKIQSGGSIWDEGSRNESLFKLSASLRAKGLDIDSIEAVLLVENKKKCNPPLQDSEVKAIAQGAGRYPSGEVRVPLLWSQAIPLPSLEIQVPALDPELIPEPLRSWALDISDRMQSASEMIVAPALVTLSGMIGRRLAIRPKKNDDWTVIPNLWGGIIAPPSAMKTPAMKEAMKPLSLLERLSLKQFQKQWSEYQIRLDEAKKNKGTLLESPPVRKRRLVHDSTIERLSELLSHNPNGLIVFRDELYGFLKGMEKSGRESDRQFYLESFSGDSAFSSDRIGRGNVDVPALCLSILGGIQPDRISLYFSETIKSGSGDDGFLSRFQLLVYPARGRTWSLIDRRPDRNARIRVNAIFKNLDEIDFAGKGFPISHSDGQTFVRFSKHAQVLFFDWLGKLEKRLRSGKVDSPAFEAHLTKYRKLMPALALIFHVIDLCDPHHTLANETQVGTRATKRAIKWCQFLEAHAMKIYADAIRPQVACAHLLSKRLRAGDIADQMTVRTLYRKEWSQLRDPKTVRLGLSLLEDHHWIKLVEESPLGRGAPSEVIYVNPELKGKLSNEKSN